MTSADDARAILAGFGAVGVESVAIDEADGRVLAEAVAAAEDLPPWPRAAMDGYAVRSADGEQPRRVVGTLGAGEVWRGRLERGEALATSTGGVLPGGADAVVMVEHTRLGDSLEITRPVAPGQNVVRPGDDVRRGEPIAGRGRRLGPRDLAVLAALGIPRMSVHRRPRVGILSTGSEVIPAALTPGPGQIRDVNSTALAAQVRRAGGVVVSAGIASDDSGELQARIAALAESCDLVLVSGGSSVGARDLTARALAEMGAEIRFHGIDIRPGKPMLLADLRGKPVMGLPGVPVSAMVVFDVFVRPLVARLGGDLRADWPGRRRARLSRDVASQPGREDYVLVGLVSADVAEPLPRHALASLARADGLVVIPASRASVAAGEEVEVVWS